MTEVLRLGLAASAEMRLVCEALLQQSLALTGAPLGNVQLVDWRAGELNVVAQLGFQSDFLRFFARVNYQDSCACAQALATRAPIVVADVMSDAAFAPYRDIADRAGFRAVQSTPLISSSSALVGMVSTHFPAAHAPTDQELASLREAGRQTADMIIAQRARRRRMSGSSLATQREMEKAEEYRQNSAECRERSLHSQDAAEREQFLDLAMQWRELADQIE
jgi:GAF domain-containing protein